MTWCVQQKVKTASGCIWKIKLKLVILEITPPSSTTVYNFNDSPSVNGRYARLTLSNQRNAALNLVCLRPSTNLNATAASQRTCRFVTTHWKPLSCTDDLWGLVKWIARPMSAEMVRVRRAALSVSHDRRVCVCIGISSWQIRWSCGICWPWQQIPGCASCLRTLGGFGYWRMWGPSGDRPGDLLVLTVSESQTIRLGFFWLRFLVKASERVWQNTTVRELKLG